MQNLWIFTATVKDHIKSTTLKSRLWLGVVFLYYPCIPVDFWSQWRQQGKSHREYHRFGKCNSLPWNIKMFLNISLSKIPENFPSRLNTIVAVLEKWKYSEKTFVCSFSYYTMEKMISGNWNYHEVHARYTRKMLEPWC